MIELNCLFCSAVFSSQASFDAFHSKNMLDMAEFAAMTADAGPGTPSMKAVPSTFELGRRSSTVSPKGSSSNVISPKGSSANLSQMPSSANVLSPKASSTNLRASPTKQAPPKFRYCLMLIRCHH